MGNNKPSKGKKELPVKYTPDKVRQLLKAVRANIHPDTLLKASSEMWNKFEASPASEQEAMVDKLNEKLEDASAVVGLENHYLIAEAVNKDKHRTFLIELANQLIQEYGCKTASEKMLAETAAWAFCRMIEYSSKLNNLTRDDYISALKTGYYSMLSKEVDRATRQYHAAINSLRRAKQPPLSVNLRTKNAFVAQNQQINSGDTQGATNARQ